MMCIMTVIYPLNLWSRVFCTQTKLLRMIVSNNPCEGSDSSHASNYTYGLIDWNDVIIIRGLNYDDATCYIWRRWWSHSDHYYRRLQYSTCSCLSCLVTFWCSCSSTRRTHDDKHSLTSNLSCFASIPCSCCLHWVALDVWWPRLEAINSDCWVHIASATS
jgi:hypothetical protein